MNKPVKFNLRLPPDLHRQAAETAQAMGMSLNTFAMLALRNWTDYQGKRLGPRAPQAMYQRPPSPVPKPAASPPSTAAPWGNVGRNDPCPCGSGQKFKRCHGGPM